jgi:prevent-host-death family protein
MIENDNGTRRGQYVTLPDWAFKALAELAIDTLIDRTEHETIIITRRGTPDLVLLSHERWTRLLEGAQIRAGELNQKEPQG